MTHPIAFRLLALGLSLSPAVLAQEADPLAALLERARASRPAAPARCTGQAEVSGAEHALELAFDGAGRFRLDLRGPLGTSTGCDGARTWQVEHRAGVPFGLDLFLGDLERGWCGVWTGAWTEPGFGFELLVPIAVGDVLEEDDGGPRLSLRSPRSSYTATLVLDPDTLAPRTLRSESWAGAWAWSFDALEDGLARRVERRDPAGNVDVFRVARVAPLDAPAAAPCGARPPCEPTNVAFDPEAAAELEVRLAPSGHLMVRPRVDGQEVGWFFFDTGAPTTTLDPDVADELGLSVEGHSMISGGGTAIAKTGLRRAASLELGPIRIDGPVFTEFEPISDDFVGIVGWDVLIQAVVEIDMQRAAIAIHPREGYELPAGEWRGLTLHLRHPHFEASFDGGHEGLFRFDTGQGHMPVLFHTPAVQRLGLLEGRDTTPIQAMGAGGPIQLRVGSIGWFEVAGHRVERPQTLFCMDESGALADPNSLGNLGAGVVEPFVLVFDYQGERVGFVPREALGER